jgi:hypothetical protein
VTRVVVDSEKRAEQAAASKEPVTFEPVPLADYIEEDVPRVRRLSRGHVRRDRRSADDGAAARDELRGAA